MKIPKRAPRLPFVSNLFSWPVSLWRNFLTPLRFFGRTAKVGEEQVLADLRDLPGVYLFQHIDDASLGGMSDGSVDWTTQGIEFSGFVDAEKAPKMIELPFFMFYKSFWIAVRTKANILRVEARRLPLPEGIDDKEKDLVLPLLINIKVANLETRANIDLYVSRILIRPRCALITSGAPTTSTWPAWATMRAPPQR